jgi:tetratricopeptide (TPR) repeat protein
MAGKFRRVRVRLWEICMRHFSVLRLVVVLALITTIFSGCSRDPNVRKQKYFASGKTYFESGKYREAAIQFGNAIQVDPRYAEAHYQLAQTNIKLQDWLHAYQELNRTLELQPENYQAHIDIANLLIADHEASKAKEHIDLLLQKDANDPQVHEAAANLLSAEADYSGAVQQMQKAIALAPNRWESYLNLGLLQMRTNQPDPAEVSFKKAVELSPSSMSAQLALGGYYQSRGRFTEAERQLRQAIAVDAKNPEPRAQLARLFLSEGKPSDAEQFLQQSKADFPNDSVGYRMLGDFYFATGDVTKAIAEYTALYEDHPKDPQVKKNYIQLLILKDRLDEAQKLNDEVLKVAPSDDDALIYRGQIQIRQGHGGDAIQTLQTVVKNDSNNGVAHYHLGVAFEQVGDLPHAQNEWQTAIRLRPELVEAHVALATLALRTNDMATLDQAASQIINLRPNAPDGYALRSVASINRKQFERAQQDIQKAISVAPESAVGYKQMGNLSLAQQKFGDAEKSFQQALDRDPSSADALGGLMNAYLAQQQPDKAVAVVNTQIAKVPASSPFYNLLGTILFNSKKDFPGADAALKKSAQLDKHNSDALAKLGQVQIAEGSVDTAIATYQQALKDNPTDPRFSILLGELYESKQEWEQAKANYQKALEIKPEDPLASNNLAYVMLQTGGNVDVAMALAQTARRGMPDSPNYADTLGWVLYQKRAYRSSIDLFQEAIKLNDKAKAPENATLHYHLGLAYEKSDQKDLARQQFERVLKINPNYSDAAEVKKQLAQLHS